MLWINSLPHQCEEIHSPLAQEGGEVGLGQENHLDHLVRVFGIEGRVPKEDLVCEAAQLQGSGERGAGEQGATHWNLSQPTSTLDLRYQALYKKAEKIHAVSHLPNVDLVIIGHDFGVLCLVQSLVVIKYEHLWSHVVDVADEVLGISNASDVHAQEEPCQLGHLSGSMRVWRGRVVSGKNSHLFSERRVFQGSRLSSTVASIHEGLCESGGVKL